MSCQLQRFDICALLDLLALILMSGTICQAWPVHSMLQLDYVLVCSV